MSKRADAIRSARSADEAWSALTAGNPTGAEKRAAVDELKVEAELRRAAQDPQAFASLMGRLAQ
jgi:hypothetical protein